MNDVCGILVKRCKQVIVREYFPFEFSGMEKNTKMQLLNSYMNLQVSIFSNLTFAFFS